MSAPVQMERTELDGNTTSPSRVGPGRWLLTWAGGVRVVNVTAISLIVAFFIVVN